MQKEQKFYTQEQLDIELVKNKQDHMGQVLDRIEKRLDRMDGIIDRLDKKIDYHFYLIIGAIVGLASIMAHGFKWF